MKSILTLILLVTVAALQAQVTQKDLQGTWKLVSYKTPQVAIDALKGTFVLDAAYKAGLTPEQLKEEEHNYTIMARQYKVSTVTFKDNNATQVIGEETYTGTFTLENIDGITEITVTESDGTEEDSVQVVIKNKQMHISIDEESELVYKKQ